LQKQIVQINGYLSSGSSIFRLMGNAIGGLIFTFAGVIGSFIFQSGIYTIAFILLGIVKLSYPGDRYIKEGTSYVVTQSIKQKVVHFLSQWKEGYRLFYRNQPIFKIVIGTSLFNIASLVGPLYVVLVADQYGGTAKEFGLLQGAGIVAGILTGLIAGKVAKKIRPSVQMTLSYAVMGCSLITLGLVSNITFAYMLYFLFVFFSGMAGILLNSILIILVPENQRARVFTIFVSLSACLIPVSSLLGGYLTDLYHVSYMFIFAGIWVCLLSGFPIIVREIRELKKLTE
jgi:DHA3 family macrolide efflux protein-like MFS transporter